MQRLDAVARWVDSVKHHPPSVWGEQQNRLVEAQLASARAAGLGADHYRALADIDGDEAG